MKNSNIYKGKLPFQSEFSHRYACWAKMKKSNKRIAKRRLQQEWLRSKNDIEMADNEHTHY